MTKDKQYYKNLLDNIEYKIELHLNNVLSENIYRSPKAEEYIIALCNARIYIKDKLKEFALEELCEINADICKLESDKKEVNNEG